MKNLKHFILPILATVFMVSCSSDDDTLPGNNNNPNETPEGNYFPSTINNYWKYNVSSTNNTTNEAIISQDSLYVIAETAATLMLDVNDGLPANGPIIGLLSSGTLAKTDTTLSLDGALELPADIADLIDLEINLDNFVLYNTEANSNTQLATTTNTITQDFNGFPLTITYQLTSTALNFDANLTLNNTAYSNVVSSKMALNIEVTTEVEAIPGFPPIQLSVLDAQDILVSTNYYADGIGLVQANSETSYQISATAITALETAGITLPIPASGSTTIDQLINNYNIAE